MAIIEEDVVDKEHDKGYKDILSNKDAFLHFLKKYIAASWAMGITVDDIERVDKSFVTQEYKHLDSDLIYKLKMNGADVYFYVLLELQSTVDYTMPFRLLMYIVALLTDVFKNTDKAARERKCFRLPAVVPIVLYNGKDNWTAARSYREYTDNHEVFGDSIIDFNYLLFDLKRTDESMILSSRKLLDIIFAYDKDRFGEDDLNEMAKRLGALVPDLDDDSLSTLFRWMSHVLYGGKVASSKIKEVFQQSIKQGGENIMVHAAAIYCDQREERAVRNARVEVAKRMIADGDDVNKIVRISGLDQNDVLKLKGVM